MSVRTWVPLTVMVAAGTAVAVIAGVDGALPAHDVAVLVAWSAGAALAVGVVGALALGRLRRSSLRWQVAFTAMVPVVAVGIGVAVAASEMFIDHHDLHALAVILVAAGVVGLLGAYVLARRLAAAGSILRGMATELAQVSSVGPLGSTLDGPVELASLAAELSRTSGRLAEAREQTAAVERSRRELVAWVSHDLRTPLAGIIAMCEALEDGVVADADTVERYHRTMRREAQRLAGLVDDLFELSRIEGGVLGLDLEQVGLDELVAEAVAGASIAASSKQVELLGVVSEPPPIVELSTPEMTRVVRNLLSNSIRHTPPGGTVRVEARLSDDRTSALVSVRDTCGGIPDHDIDHVFELAYRGDAARTPGEGAGLGLAVARGLVEAHQGEITVRNEGDGCRFTVRLPLIRVSLDDGDGDPDGDGDRR